MGDAPRTAGVGGERGEPLGVDAAGVPGWSTHRELGWEELLTESRRLGRDDRFRTWSDREVEEGLSVGAAQIDAAWCRWLELLAEFVVRGGWAEQGARTPGAWLSWKLGIGSSTAREQVRVALRLREFPRLRDRFAAGRLSYSKVRALTRFGDPAFEDVLLRWADGATAAQLESVARGFRTAERARADGGDQDGEVGWSCSGRTCTDGTRSLTLRGPVEVIARIEQQMDRLAQHAVDDRAAPPVHPDPDGLGGDAEQAAVSRADVVAADAIADAADIADASADADAQGTADDLGDAPSVTRVTAADRIEALAAAVSVVVAGELPADTSGLDRDTLVLHAAVEDVALALRDVPDAIDPMPVDGGSAVPVDGDAAVTQARGSGASRSTGTPRRTGRRPNADVVAVADEHGRVRGMDRRALRRLACEAGIVLVALDRDGSPVDVGRRSRRTTAALRRALHRRDGGCTFPGCDASRHLHAHHVQHWADDGPTDLSNLVLLCSFHHRFVHQRGSGIEVRTDGHHVFRTADRHTIEPVGPSRGASAEAVAAGAPSSASAEALRAVHFTGGPYDLSLVVAVLQQEHERLRPGVTLAA